MRKLLLLTLLSIPLPVNAAVPACGPREPIIKGLHAEYGEEQMMLGMSRDGTVIEVWHNPATGTFTFMKTNIRNRLSCLVDEGENLYLIPEEKKGKSNDDPHGQDSSAYEGKSTAASP